MVFLTFVKTVWKPIAHTTYMQHTVRENIQVSPSQLLTNFKTAVLRQNHSVLSLTLTPLSTQYQPNETKSLLIRRSCSAVQKFRRPRKVKFYYDVRQNSYWHLCWASQTELCACASADGLNVRGTGKLDVHGTKIFKVDFNRQGVIVWTRFIRLK